MKTLFALLAGTLFGAGLAASGMTDQTKVIGFLDLFGDWKIDLVLVMAGAVTVTFLSTQLVLKRGKPVFDSSFFTPTKTAIDAKLLIGSGLFGVGWGLVGYCPGPAVAALAYSLQEIVTGAGLVSWQPIVFVIAMLAGMYLADRLVKA